jgi:septal ring factor EnvC (AmiA/AmiB activator)
LLIANFALILNLCLLQDDLALVESDLMINQSKIANWETSNKSLHAQLATMRAEMKTTQEALKTSEEALKAKDAERLQQLKAMERAHNAKLDIIANVIHQFARDMFDKSPIPC